MSIAVSAVLLVIAALAAWAIAATIRSVIRDTPRPVCFDPCYDSRQPTLRR